MRVLAGQQRRPIDLIEPPLHEGGEGAIHAVQGKPILVGKIVKPNVPLEERKVIEIARAMPTSTSIYSFCTPTEPLYELKNASHCIGCLMAYEAALTPLFLINRELRNGRRGVGDGLMLARHITQAFAALHHRGVVMGDVNDTNILEGSGKKAVFVDIDSFQVANASEVFRCTVGRPEFTPPELQGARFGSVTRVPASDLFGVGVIVFGLLMHGHHPFAAGYTGPGNTPTIGARIKQGAFPNALGGIPHYRPKRSMPDFAALPNEVQRLFRECFEGGHRDPYVRPSAAEWNRVLQAIDVADLSGLAANRNRAASPSSGAPSSRIPWRFAAILGAASLTTVAIGVHALPNMPPAANEASRHHSPSGQATPRLWRDLSVTRHHK